MGEGSRVSAVQVAGLDKSYGPTVALDGLDLEVRSGTITGFLGPNGAGKTTTFRVLLGLTRPDRGRVRVLGEDLPTGLDRIVKRVGAIVDEPGLLSPLTGHQNLVVAAHTLGFGNHRINGLVDFVGLADAIHRPVSGYSKGMRQRLALAAALIGDPELLLLDEPLDGLDPAGQHIFKQKLRALVDGEGRTVVVSSHDLADVEALVDDVVVIVRGHLRFQGTLGALLGARRRLRVVVADRQRARATLGEAGFAVEEEDGGLVVDADDGAPVARALAQAGLFPSALYPVNDSLERVFLEMTS